MLLKTLIREQFTPASPRKDFGNAPGRIGEHLRRSEAYRQASHVFVSPAQILRQVRTNILTDNKTLIMPSPNMREGFYLLKPFSVPFKDIGMAVTLAGITRFGVKLKAADLGKLRLDLLVADVLAVDCEGYMVGDGHGFFDLAVAIFATYGAVTAQTMVVAVATEPQKLAEALAHDPWDVRAHGILSADGFNQLRNPEEEKRPIFWEQLTLDRIKRITPLWQLYSPREEERALASPRHCIDKQRMEPQ